LLVAAIALTGNSAMVITAASKRATCFFMILPPYILNWLLETYGFPSQQMHYSITKMGSQQMKANVTLW